ncbi:polyprenyl synthetase family protein [Nocardiopsis sp. NPDC058631]|uniref:polyprenyl synthetase family protein n=1 Tax=Nocardiopsis sp. NPDC058631 TaxID=3346566 RepID=UPI00364A420E
MSLAMTPEDDTDRRVCADAAACTPPGADHDEGYWRFVTWLDDGGSAVGLTVHLARYRVEGADGGPTHAHAATWHIRHRDTESCADTSWTDTGFLDLARAEAENDPLLDRSVRAAMLDLLKPGDGLYPDRELPGPVVADEDGLDLDYGGAVHLRAVGDDLLLDLRGDGCAWRLRLTPGALAVPRTAVDGAPSTWRSQVVPRVAVEGLRDDADGERPVHGTGWYEHVLPDAPRNVAEPVPDSEPVWTRAVALLDDGWTVTATRRGRADALTGQIRTEPAEVVLHSPEGERTTVRASVSDAVTWTSPVSLRTHVTECVVEAPGGLRLRVRAWFPFQESRALLHGIGTLVAHADVEGVRDGVPVHGRGHLESRPAGRITRFEPHMRGIGALVREEVRRVYPDSPDRDALTALAGLEEHPDALEASVVDDLHAALVRPVRHIADGAGKGMRTYLWLQIVDLYGGDTEQLKPMLAVIEGLQAGNLMIDDIQDRSPVRRGRPAAHTVFGEALTINAGTDAYFLVDQVLPPILPGDERLLLSVYRVVMGIMRVGHAGQALDITGHATAMDEAVRTGEAGPLLKRIRTAHLLKTALPIRSLAEIAALLSGASEKQVLAVRSYSENVGLAFQIGDDALDLSGVAVRAPSGARMSTKLRAEDLRQGKVTMPLAHAVALLPPDRVRALWARVRAGVTDEAEAARIADELIACGAARACEDECRALVTEGWDRLRADLPRNWSALGLHALGTWAVHRNAEW